MRVSPHPPSGAFFPGTVSPARYSTDALPPTALSLCFCLHAIHMPSAQKKKPKVSPFHRKMKTSVTISAALEKKGRSPTRFV